MKTCHVASFLIIVVWSLRAMPSLAQPSIVLSEVEIHGKKPLTSALEVEWDSALLRRYTNQTVADLLAASGGVVVNQYAPGGLSSLSVRGTSAAHTAILWNGFNLQSIMNGQYDLQLLPLYAVDKVRLSEGIAGARYGSGAMGGVLHLESAPSWNTGLRGGVGHTVGSFGLHIPSANIQYGGAGAFLKATAIHTQAHQKYPFKNAALAEAPTLEQTNSDIIKSQWTLDGGLRSDRWGELHVWLLDMRSERGIPPPMTKSLSVARQWDEHRRMAMAYTNTYRKHTLSYRAAYIREQIRFADSLINLDQSHSAASLLQKVDYTYAIGQWRIELLSEIQYFTGTSPGYKPLPIRQQRTALVPGVLYTDKEQRWRIQAQMRMEQVDQKAIPAIPSVQGELKLLHWWKLGAQASASYRVPTFNDLYWSPGGNKNLKPEQGMGADVFTTFSTNTLPFIQHAALQLGAYRQHISQWIVWLPGDRFWSPQNEDRVTIEGLQSKLNFHTNRSAFNLHGTSRVNVGRSILSAPTDPDRGKLLRYTPTITAAQQLGFTTKRIHVALEHGYTGWRYTDRSNTRWLPAVSLWHFHAGVGIPYRQHRLDLSLSIQNVLNSTYQMLAWQAMPGRVIQLSAFIHFQSKSKN